MPPESPTGYPASSRFAEISGRNPIRGSRIRPSTNTGDSGDLAGCRRPRMGAVIHPRIPAVELQAPTVVSRRRRRRVVKRRDFLFGFVGTGAVAHTNPFSRNLANPSQETAKITDYRTLGRTGFKVSDIGSGVPTEEGVLNALLSRGVNYIDTSDTFSNGASERLIGRVIQGFDRRKVFITTKLHVAGNETTDRIKDRALRSLERLDSEHIDCLMIHGAVSRTHVRNEAFHEAAAELKKEGRLRHIGVSCHGSSWYDEPEDSMEDVLGAAIEDGRFDVLLLAYNYLQRDMGERILRRCREKNVGATLMKTDPFGYGVFTYLNDLYSEQERRGQEAPEWIQILRRKYSRQREEARSFLDQHNLAAPDQVREAAIRFVLTNPDMHSVAITFKSFDDVEYYLRLSGSRLYETDQVLLRAGAETTGRMYCRHACNLCESECPERVPVNTVMRYHHYFVAQGREKLALDLYRKLEGPKAGSCMECEGHCQAACPFEVPIHDLLKFAHENLTLA